MTSTFATFATFVTFATFASAAARGRSARAWLLTLTGFTCIGCAGELERATTRELQRRELQLAPLPAGERATTRAPRPTAPAQFDGSLGGYQRYAFAHSPELRASFEAWRAATYRPAKTQRVPELMVSYAGFIRSVETRVGPQRHRLGVQQWLPWPTQLTAARDAEALAARASQREFEAHALRLAAEVSAAYWRLWLIERAREVERERLELLRQLAEFVRIRVEANAADLSQLTQLNLQVTRAEDRLAAQDEEARAASATLTRVVGAPARSETPIAAAPPRVGLPGEDEAALREAAAAHPRVQAMALMSSASEQRARRSRADRYPSLGLGVDWIITGPAIDPAMPDSGKDAVVGMAAIKLPLSLGAYKAGEREADAQREMFRARELAARDRALEEYEHVLARLRDADRRVALYERSMIPMAETSLAAVQASYQSSTASVAELLMAERELLELRLQALRARVDGALAWAALEHVVGRPVRSPEETR